MEFDTKEIIFNKRVEEKKIHKEIQKVISQKSHEQKRLLQIENEELVTDKPKIGRASCRERVSDQV